MAPKKDFTLRPTTAKQMMRYAAGEPEPGTEPRAAADFDNSQKKAVAQKRRTRESQQGGRITMAFSPEVYDYIRIMSRIKGQSLALFIEDSIRKRMGEDAAQYELAKQIME